MADVTSCENFVLKQNATLKILFSFTILLKVWSPEDLKGYFILPFQIALDNH